MISPSAKLDGFYLVIDKTSAGPFTEAQLREHLASGKLTPETFVWRGGMGAWLQAKDVDAFKVFFGEVPPPIPEMDEDPSATLKKSDPRKNGRRTPSRKASIDGEADDDPWFSEEDPTPTAAAEDPFAVLMAESAENLDSDPFEALSAQADETARKNQNSSAFVVGEQTRFFMIQAGMTQKQRNPPWKIALFIALLLGIPMGTLFAMSQITVQQTIFNEETGRTETVEVTMLSEVSGGISDLRDTLLGIGKPSKEKSKETKRHRSPKREKRPSPHPDLLDDVALPASPDEALGQRIALGPQASKSDFDFKTAQTDNARARALYQSDERRLTGPIGRKDAKGSTPGLDGAPALSSEVMSGVIARNQKAFQSCTENELRRNPRFRGGKINLTFTIGSSGMVTQAKIDRPEIDQGEIGTCLKQSARRIVFPSFEGEPFDLEVPLVLTSGF